MLDKLGDRIKSQYEDRARYFLPRRTYTIIRLDGKAFHTYTKGLNKPFDDNLIQDFQDAIKTILPEIQGAAFAYHQSDEISILLTDFATPTTCAWFDGNIQKICSVSASLITAEFNKRRMLSKYINIHDFDSAYFDSRVFIIPDRTEVMNYFIWRGKDCSRNSISMLAQSLFSHKELQGKSSSEKIEMIKNYNNAFNWDSLNPNLKYGNIIVKENYLAQASRPAIDGPQPLVERTRWVSKPAWKFTDNDDLLNLIPKYE